ncbi:MAG: hypothetical protein Q8M15_05890 [Bacteroidota bacterium]|nr:hypothetical protein [Bacteroidota bacterium]
MKKNNFYTSLTLFTLIIAVVLFIVKNIQQKFVIDYLTWGALIYFLLLTIVIYKISYSALSKKNEIFLGRIYSAIGLRFVFSIFPLIIYMIFVSERQIPFIIVYLLLYFFYTAFEIYFLVVNLRPDSKK